MIADNHKNDGEKMKMREIRIIAIVRDDYKEAEKYSDDPG